MFKDKKEDLPFANIGKVSAAANPPPRTAREEWECVHSYEDAMKWHLKWTPWFTKDMIEGILKYAYPSEILKEGKDQILDFTGKISTKKEDNTTKINVHVTVSPDEDSKEPQKTKCLPGIPIRREASIKLTKTQSESIDDLPESQDKVEERSNRFERFWTLNP